MTTHVKISTAHYHRDDMTINQARKILRAKYGARHYRITRDGGIHVYGPIPHSISTGWWLYGYTGKGGPSGLINDNETRDRLEDVADSLRRDVARHGVSVLGSDIHG